MSKLLLLGSWHAGANCTQYADAFRSLGHEVVTCGPRFTSEDADRWHEDLLEMEWPPTKQEADEYAAKVLAESPTPDLETGKGERLWQTVLPDAVLSFDQYGETPRLDNHPLGVVPCASIYGDTHTGRIQAQRAGADAWDHVFVQFRRGDLEFFDHPSKHWLPAAANPTIWRPYPEVEKDIDVLFVGSTHPAVHKDRVALIRYLQDNGINVTVKHAFGSDAARLMARAKVVLNKSLAGDLNMRVPEALACGAVLVTDQVDGLSRFYPLNEDSPSFWEYETHHEALQHIRWCLRWPAEAKRMGERAAFSAKYDHTYEHRARQLLQTMGLPEEGDGNVGRTSSASRSDVRDHVHVVGLSPRVDDDAQTPLAHPTVSIIIPTYNRWDLTQKCVQSIADTVMRGNAEVVLVDDGSTEPRPETWPLIGIRMARKENGGFCSAVNYGVKHAKGEYVIVLNNDTTPEEGWLAPLLDELRHGAGIVGSLILNPDGTTQAAGLCQMSDGTWRNVERYDPTTGLPVENVDAVMGACFAMRRDTFLRLGGLDEVWGNGGCCEVDLSLRVAKEGLPVRLRLDSKVRHAEGSTRFHVDGIQEKIAENTRRIIERWGMPDVRNGNADSGRGDVPDSGGDARRVHSVPDVRSELGGTGTREVERRPLVVAWQGHFNAEQGGSLALINAVLKKELPKYGVIVHDYFAPGYIDIVLDVTRSERDGLPRMLVSHYFTPDGWEEPPANIEHWAAVAPWEYPPSVTDFPDGWKRVAQNKRLEEIWTPSEYARGLLSPLFGAERVKVIPNGVDLDLFNPDGEKAPGRPDLWRCLFVGGMIYRKGLDRLYDAWRLAFPPEEGAPAVLIIKSQGRTTFYQGQTIEPPADLVRPQNVYPTISVIDRDMEATELAEIYRKVDCLVHPFRYEGFCLPLLEAMASGKPVVYSGHAPATEFVSDSSGLAIPSVNHEIDVTALARGLRWLYEHREDAAAMGAEGRKAAMAYSWPSVAERYATAIRRICG